jgi:hypothetical protein
MTRFARLARRADRLARLCASTVASPTQQREMHLPRVSRRPSTVNSPKSFQENEMGKYFLGWILGVPVVVLVGIYLVMHVL